VSKIQELYKFEELSCRMANLKGKQGIIVQYSNYVEREEKPE